MEQKIVFQDLPQALQDSLRDAPITSIVNGEVLIECLGNYKGHLCEFSITLKPRSMDPNAIIYVTQDLQDIEVSMLPIQQVVSA